MGTKRRRIQAADIQVGTELLFHRMMIVISIKVEGGHRFALISAPGHATGHTILLDPKQPYYTPIGTDK